MEILQCFGTWMLFFIVSLKHGAASLLPAREAGFEGQLFFSWVDRQAQQETGTFSPIPIKTPSKLKVFLSQTAQDNVSL